MSLKLHFLFFIFCLFLLSAGAARAITVEITATVAGCGDGVIGSGEQCDGSDLGGATCSSQGFSGGTLSCSSACTFNTSQCTSGGGGGGGYSSTSITTIPNTNVVFTGRAYPRSTVTLLKDAQIVATTIASADANFQVTISNISGGNYLFSVYSEDNKGNRSSLLTFPVGITAGVTTKVSDIFIAPSLAVDKSEVRKGDTISIFGQSVPTAAVTITIGSDQDFFVQGSADSSGIYLLNFDTTPLEMGQHTAKSKSSFKGEISPFSKVTSFIVGTQNILAQAPTQSSLKGDTNSDSRVNLVDFSVAAYWYKRPSPPATADLNGDKKVDLVDFSIMAYYWTG